MVLEKNPANARHADCVRTAQCHTCMTGRHDFAAMSGQSIKF
jgi:hypothetical protein